MPVDFCHLFGVREAESSAVRRLVEILFRIVLQREIDHFGRDQQLELIARDLPKRGESSLRDTLVRIPEVRAAGRFRTVEINLLRFDHDHRA